MPRDTARAPSASNAAASPAASPAAAVPTRTAPARPARKPVARTANVRINGLAYIPSRLEIAAGTTVQWKNTDPLVHTVTATNGSFGSPQFGLDGTWKHTFTKPGTYTYYCTLHPNMKATVVVK
jgi:plastocyanin